MLNNTDNLWRSVENDILVTVKRLNALADQEVFNRLRNFRIYDIAFTAEYGPFSGEERTSFLFAANSWLKLINASNQFNKQIKTLTTKVEKDISRQNRQQYYISIFVVIITTVLSLVIFIVLTNKIDTQTLEKQKVYDYLLNVINSLKSILISIDNQNRITQWNAEAETVTGIKTTDALNQNIIHVLPNFHDYLLVFKEVTEHKIRKTIHKRQLFDLKDSFYDIHFDPIIGEINPGIVIRIDDITEFEKIQQQLIQSQKMEIVGTLAGGLAHDFNNALGGLTATVSLLEHKLGEIRNLSNQEITTLLEKYLSTINLSTTRATDIVKQLLNISRKYDLDLRTINLNDTVKDVINICSNTFDKSIQIVAKYHHQSATITADATQIEQAILNICVNASHSMTIMRPPDDTYSGKLIIKIGRIHADKFFKQRHPEAVEDSYWLIGTSDTGIGIKPETLPKIFDPFFTTKEKDLGTGLGLSMVYSLVKQHYGFIDVYSEPGIGSTFNLYFPDSSTNSVENDFKTEENGTPTGSGLILIVDDDEVIRKSTRAILEELGYSTISAANGEEGVKVYSDNFASIDVVLLDMQMPIVSGLEALIEIKKINANVKVILSSGYRHDERVGLAMRAGANIFLQKPFTMSELATGVHKLIQNI